MPHSIALITDSTCDIPKAWREQYEIAIVPLNIIFGVQAFLDGVDLHPRDFYGRLVTDTNHPKTSQPSAGAFLDAYRRAQERGADQAVVFTLSGALSGTVGSARSAAQESHIPVEVVDSKTTSMGLGWQVIAAARERERGGNLDALLVAAQRVRERVYFLVSLDTIEFLARGGRFADAARFLNAVLQIKPMVQIRSDTGTISALVPSRSRKSAIEALYKEFFKRVDPAAPVHIAVLHNAADAEANALAERIRRECQPVEIFTSLASPVLGVHSGPRALALCGYSE